MQVLGLAPLNADVPVFAQIFSVLVFTGVQVLPPNWTNQTAATLAIELRQSKGVNWHYFCIPYTEFRGRTFSRVSSEVNDFFSAQFILRSIHK